jgi:glycosyltransferase involved in cell wall biosynthesis
MLTKTSPSPKQFAPRFSIISAVYNVEKYLDDFIGSIERQQYPLNSVEVIMVDDGSTDGSLRRLEEWRRRRPGLVRVLSQPNGGQASARNLGLAHATGEWVTFTDPDDTIDGRYLSEVDAFLKEYPETELVATNRRVIHEATGLETLHALHRHFTRKNRLRNLYEHPAFFHGSAPSGFFKRAALEQEGIRFDERIRPNFEDGHFCASYLLSRNAPLVGFLYSAAYFYRKRADQSSTLNSSRSDPRRYTDVLEFGYLDILRQSQRRLGRPPEWLQNFILYELSWYFQDEESAAQVETAAFDEVGDRLQPLLKAIAALLQPSVIEGFSVRRFDPAWRDVLLQLNSNTPWHTPFVTVDAVDPKQKLVRIVYRYTQTLPDEQFFSDGIEAKPVYQKIRGFCYFDRTMLKERLAWLPLGTIRVTLDGHDMNVRLREPSRPVHSLSATAIRDALDPLPKTATGSSAPAPERLRAAAITRLAKTQLVRRYFKDAWVLMDRINNADDSGEHLFRYLRRHKRRINAWFVLQRDSLDYQRLRTDGYLRLVPHGSLRWKLLMLNAKHVISSHADVPITRPPEILKLISKPTWRFTFLQHGVIKDDLSNWLNPKGFDIFITSTTAERRSIVADGTNYRYTEREVKLTGLPRFDRLRQAGARIEPAQRDYLLIAPTWRSWLEQPDPLTQQKTIDQDIFGKSEFADNWMRLIGSEKLRNLAADHSCTVAVLLHPNLQPLTGVLNMPDWVKKLTFAGQNVQEIFARARVLITDYSSMAFNAAYIERPVVYFQFDRERVFRGGHLGRRGYFSYERDGFGPVAFTVPETEDAVVRAVACGPSPQPEFLRRIEEAFPNRDGRCCERVVQVIRESTRPISRRGLAIGSKLKARATSLNEESAAESFRRVGVEASSESAADGMSPPRSLKGNQA